MYMTAPTFFERTKAHFQQRMGIIAVLLALMWAVEIIDIVFLDQAMNGLGLSPRRESGIWGIFLMPFLHAGMEHLLANSLPFVVLGGLIIWRRVSDFFVVTIATSLLVGLIIWLFGASNAIYIGASGLVFGYFGFLVFRGYFERSLHSLFVAIMVVVLYGGLILGIVPQGNGISWEAHLFGFLSGAVCARLLSRPTVSEEPPLVIISGEDRD